MKTWIQVITEIMNSGEPLDARQWAAVLGVSLDEISAWQNGEKLPTPSQLRSIEGILVERSGRGESFIEVINRPPREVMSPELGMQMEGVGGGYCRSIRHYMIQDGVMAFLRLLGAVSEQAQEDILDKACELAHIAILGRPPTRY